MQGAARFLKAILQVIWKRRLIVLVLAALVAAAMSITGQFSELNFADEREYFDIAQNLLRHGIYGLGPDHEPTAHRAPGYVLFITPLLGLGIGKYAIDLAQIALWIFNAHLAARLALKLYGHLAASAALTFSLAYPIFLYASLRLYPQILTATLLLSTLYLLFCSERVKFFPLRAIAVGIIVGASILVTPPIAMVLLSILVLTLVLRTLSLPAATTIAVTASLTITPWLVRNWIVFDRPLLAATGGITLLQGNSENSQPQIADPDISRYREAAKGLDAFESDRYYRNAAIEWMKDNPRLALTLYVRKVFQFFNFQEKYATPGAGNWSIELLMFVSYYPILILAILNFLLVRRWPLSRPETILFLAYLGGATSYAIFLVRLRYRIPFDYLLIILASVALSKIIDFAIQDTVRGTTSTRANL